MEAPIDRPRLDGMLWPETRESRALDYLRRSLSELREAMGAEGWRIRLPTPRTLQLEVANERCDVLEFDRMARPSDESPLRRAVYLYHGPLLPDCFEDWIAPERDARQQTELAASETLATMASQRGDLADAERHLRRVSQIDLLREPAVRKLMRTRVEQDCHASAGEVYRSLRFALRRALSAEPSAEAMQLSRDNIGARRADYRQAAILHAAGSTVRQSADGTRLGDDGLAVIEDDTCKARDALGAVEYDSARTKGHAMTTEQAIAYALICGDRID